MRRFSTIIFSLAIAMFVSFGADEASKRADKASEKMEKLEKKTEKANERMKKSGKEKMDKADKTMNETTMETMDHSDLNVDNANLAIKGYDPVSYFDEEPTEGKPEIEAEYNGARYLFANEENRDKFLEEPENYAPQYGGFCATAMAEGKKVGIDPETYKIVDGKLYLFWNALIGGNTLEQWNKLVEAENNEAELIAKADKYWEAEMADPQDLKPGKKK